MVKICFSLAIALLLAPPRGAEPLCVAHDSGVDEVAPSVVLVAKVSKNEFNPLEQVEIEFEAHNGGKELAFIGGSRDLFSNVSLTVLHGKDEPLTLTRYGDSVRKRGGIRMGQPVGLAPGQIFKGKLVANLFYDMTKPGDYRIDLGLPVVSTAPWRKTISYAKSMRVRVKAPPTVGEYGGVGVVGGVELPFGPSNPIPPTGRANNRPDQ
jgi:hypothetical protein